MERCVGPWRGGTVLYSVQQVERGEKQVDLAGKRVTVQELMRRKRI